MKILENKIQINNWGLILLGLKKTWITKKSFYHLLANQDILCSEDLLVEFYLIEEEPLEALLSLLDKIIVEENEKAIIYNEFDYNQKNLVPEEYYEFWGVEFLLRLLSEDLTKDEVLDKVVLMHSDFNYLLTWNNFIRFTPVRDSSEIIGIEGLYQNIKSHIKQKLKDFINIGITTYK